MPHPAFCALLYLLDVTRSVRPAQAVSPASPRSFASWKREERQLVQILLNADIPTERVAQMIERTEEAVDYQQEGRNDRKATTSSLEHLPQTVVALCEADIELLINWQPLPLRDPLAWRYGLPFDPAFLKPAAQPTLRVITVQPDPALALPLPDPEAYGYWAASRQDQANTARATWIDLAAKLTAIGGQVILHAPDPHQSRQLAVRAAIKRHAGESAPRNSVRQSGKATAQVVLLDQPERWPVGQIAALSAQTVIVVLPSLQLPEGSLPFGSGPPADMAAAWTRLPLPLRRPDTSWEAQAAQEQHRQTQLTAWAGGRHLEELTQVGVPNSSGTEARIDWPSLRHLPPSGTVLASREDVLIQAAVWYRLALSKKAILPQTLSNRTATWKDYFPAARCPPTEAAEQLQAKLAAADADLSTRVMARVLLDLRYRAKDQPSKLNFELAEKVRVTYIGS